MWYGSIIYCKGEKSEWMLLRFYKCKLICGLSTQVSHWSHAFPPSPPPRWYALRWRAALGAPRRVWCLAALAHERSTISCVFSDRQPAAALSASRTRPPAACALHCLHPGAQGLVREALIAQTICAILSLLNLRKHAYSACSHISPTEH